MTYGQAFLALAAAAALAVSILMVAYGRWGRRGLVAGGAVLALASGAFFVARAAASHVPRAPGSLRSVVVISLVPVTVAAIIVRLRRGRGRPLLTGALAWAGLLFAFFESANLLRSWQ